MTTQYKYPQQLITSLVNQADAKLLEFFETERKRYIPKDCTLQDFVNITLAEFLNDEKSKAELKSIQTVQKRMRWQKKKRWAKSVDADVDFSSKKSSFYNIHLQYSSLTAAQFKLLYGLDNIDDVIEDLKVKIREWQVDNERYLIEYPLLVSQSQRQVLSAYKTDLIINLIDVIIHSLGGDINSFLQKKPEILIEAPFFAPQKYSIPLRKYFDDMAATLFRSDELEFEILRAHSDGEDDAENLDVLDFMDNQILAALFASIKPDFYESRQVFSYIRDIALKLNEKPNARHYQIIRQRLNKMATVSFRYRYKNPKKTPSDQGLTFAFFDSVLINSYEDGREYCNVTFSSTLYNAIIQKKIISVTSSSYNALDTEMSKLLYHSLQRERIILYLSSKPNDDNLLYNSYDISFFQRAVLFKGKRKSTNIALIKKSLDEFQQKNIAIARYTYTADDGRFNIYFHSLTPDEKIDLLQDYGSVLSSDDNTPSLPDKGSAQKNKEAAPETD